MQATRGTPLTAATDQHAADRPTLGSAAPRRIVGLVVTAVVALAADQVSKVLVVAHLEHHAPVTLVPGVLDLDVVRNGGAAFSIGTGATWLFTAIAAGVVIAIVRTASRLRSRAWAFTLGLLLGGALGNLVDRFVRSPGPLRGHVVDWIHLHHWPVFNVADSCIVVGGVVAVLLSLLLVNLDGTRGTSDEAGGHRRGGR
jgi:signal peptidase II